MNTRRKLLKFLGLGSLFATAGAVTINQARAKRGLSAIPPATASDLVSPRYRPRKKWQTKYLWIDADPRPGSTAEERNYVQIIEDAERDGWEFVTAAGVYGNQFIFRRTQWVDA